jgi:hypothetical protein
VACAGVLSRKLAGDWLELEDDQGRVYYANAVTRQTSWVRPDAAVSERGFGTRPFPRRESERRTGSLARSLAQTQYTTPCLPLRCITMQEMPRTSRVTRSRLLICLVDQAQDARSNLQKPEQAAASYVVSAEHSHKPQSGVQPDCSVAGPFLPCTCPASNLSSSRLSFPYLPIAVHPSLLLHAVFPPILTHIHGRRMRMRTHVRVKQLPPFPPAA